MQGLSQVLARVLCEAELFHLATSKLFLAVCSLKLIIKWCCQLNGIWTSHMNQVESLWNHLLPGDVKSYCRRIYCELCKTWTLFISKLKVWISIDIYAKKGTIDMKLGMVWSKSFESRILKALVPRTLSSFFSIADGSWYETETLKSSSNNMIRFRGEPPSNSKASFDF